MIDFGALVPADVEVVIVFRIEDVTNGRGLYLDFIKRPHQHSVSNLLLFDIHAKAKLILVYYNLH